MKTKNNNTETATAAPEAVGTAKSADQIKEFVAIRKRAGLKIDPETADVMWVWGEVDDPYGMYPEPSGWFRCIGRNYFARSPGSDIWVEFGDLPEATADALDQKHWPSPPLTAEQLIKMKNGEPF